LWAGVADVTVTVPGCLTVPTSGVIVHGTAISQFTNGVKHAAPPLGDGLFDCQEPGAVAPCNTVRHLWYGDAINGLCRIDPEVDAPLTTPANGFGAWNVNALACLISVNKLAIAPGQTTFDSLHNLMYTANNSRVGPGAVRVIYHPEGDNGQWLDHSSGQPGGNSARQERVWRLPPVGQSQDGEPGSADTHRCCART
jgi:hypothetical protein